MKEYKGNAADASPRPWRVDYVSKRATAVIKAADGAVVCVCHADNAELIVRAVNDYKSVDHNGESQN